MTAYAAGRSRALVRRAAASRLLSTAAAASLGARRPRLDAGVALIPHPSKASTGGEDAYFSLPSSWGVFDGVGGWADQGVDPGLFSRQLANQTGMALEAQGAPAADPLRALQQGLARTTEVGSSTACVVCLTADGRLRTLNVGDSGFRVLRAERGAAAAAAAAVAPSVAAPAAALEVVHRSAEQQHYFNCPLQLGTGSRDRPEHGARELLEVRDGDLILMATDGVFDNLFDDEIAALLAPPLASGDSAQQLAEHVARSAVAAAVHPTRRTPFAASARAHGYKHDGGKLDDVTVVCVRVIEAEAEADGAGAEGGGGEAPRSKL